MDLLPKVIKRNDAIAWRVIDDEGILVNPQDSSIYPLNTVGARIWQLLTGEYSCTRIIALLADEFEVDEAILSQDVVSFINDLISKRLAKTV